MSFFLSFLLPALGGEPIVHVLANLILRQAIALLELAFELISTPVDDVEVIVSELPPLLFHLAFDLFPVSFHATPIHYLISLIGCSGNAMCGRSVPKIGTFSHIPRFQITNLSMVLSIRQL